MFHFKPKSVEKCREREKIKTIGPFRSYTTRNRKFQKNSKKIKKIKKYHYGFLSSKIGVKRPRKGENNNYRSVPFRSYPTRNREFQKIAKKFKNLKNTIMASFQAKIGWKMPRKRKNKNYRSLPFLHDA